MCECVYVRSSPSAVLSLLFHWECLCTGEMLKKSVLRIEAFCCSNSHLYKHTNTKPILTGD